MQENKSPIVPGIIAIAILTIMVTGVTALKNKEKATTDPVSITPQTQPASDETMTSQTPTVASSEAATYKDGTYSATGSYVSPGGNERIAVTLTLENDIVSDVSATPQAASPTSRDYQSLFVKGYQTQVVGKDIDTLNLSRVSGSSLTSKGFNDALAQIRRQAR